MSEYWKSTPKYWCKFCKVFVKDTKLEKQQHDATPRHQNNIQKSLRSLHKEKEIEDRQKQRAKDEVARLNGLTGGGAGSSTGKSIGGGSGNAGSGAVPKKATLEERKRQMQQLAEMGVAVPEEFRKEMGMAGDWQTVKVTRIEQPPPGLKDEDSKDAVAFGIRKRKFEDQEEEEAILGTGDAASAVSRKNRAWGARMKAFPGAKNGTGDDLDALLGGVVVKRKGEVVAADDEVPADTDALQGVKGEGEAEDDAPALKKSDSHEEQEAAEKIGALAGDAPIKTEEAEEQKPIIPAPGAGIVFKKRKKIAR